MAWVRIHDGALTHPKIIGMFDPRSPFCLWVWGLSYSQQHLTDGLIPGDALPHGSRPAVAKLVLRRLWDALESGAFQIHDYLEWNDSRAVVVEARQLAKVRMVLVRDPELRKALRDRDQDQCRYCGIDVNWADRKSRGGATYDHINPGAGDTVENLVIACRGCNSKKGKRSPEQAGMTLQPVSRFVSRYIKTQKGLVSSGLGSFSSSGSLSERESEGKPAAHVNGTTDPEISERAGRFLDRYAELYPLHRHGARFLPKPSLDWPTACELVAVWPDDRLEKLAIIFLKTDHEFATNGSRTIRQFAALASWCDGRLSEIEAARGKA